MVETARSVGYVPFIGPDGILRVRHVVVGSWRGMRWLVIVFLGGWGGGEAGESEMVRGFGCD